jgi:hypothetical protein
MARIRIGQCVQLPVTPVMMTLTASVAMMIPKMPDAPGTELKLRMQMDF